MTRSVALIVDDEPDIRELLELTLGRMEITTHSAANVAEAKALLPRHAFDLCLTDMRLPDGDGIELVQYIQERHPEVPVAMITAFGSMDSAVQALKAGAFDFVSKPVDLQVLRSLVNSALKLRRTYPEVDRRSRRTLLGDSPVMQEIRSTINKLARSQAPVYISGESGTGKELVARLIHEKGPRSDHPFVAVNCGAIPADLMESEFFGHTKGSFTGAVADKQGLFQAANGGTLFLDEVAELPLHMQVKLLRAIQEKAVRPVGTQREVPVDVRILSATHKDLGVLIQSGDFRQDLYYRINVIDLHVPNLRERPMDIPELADTILERLAGTGAGRIRLADDALQALQGYRFPGNVRELENILERAMTLCEGHVVRRADLRLPESAPVDDPPASREVPLENYLDSVERDAILKALEKTRYNKTAAAKLLGITFRALRYRLKKLGLE
ncbi:MAG: sigma-54-dependent Fis family transcriptional regulator [Chromatiales bacterium 21-64-14]|nr:MAG: sigma-54-dependent Fis family transcriptional regulator [Chromatiales bacterium 21-64-14]HQU14875.1 sigma-54 dependent transcriptional regulator [Gammaproteobacteria bacterium]